MDWSNKWQMKFNIEKCKVIHFGYKNICPEYTIRGEKLMMIESEKDIGVLIHSPPKSAAHITNCVKKSKPDIGGGPIY